MNRLLWAIVKAIKIYAWICLSAIIFSIAGFVLALIIDHHGPIGFIILLVILCFILLVYYLYMEEQ